MQFISYHSGSSGNLYQLKGTSGNLLIEAGVPIGEIKKALGFKLNTISACLVSHEHKDHSKGIAEVARFGIDCYMHELTAKKLKLSGHRIHTVESLKQFEIDSFKIIPIPINHVDVNSGDRVPGFGFLISDGVEKLLFYIDSFYCKYRFKGLSIIALGVNYSKETLDPELDSARKKRLYRSHMSLENAIKFFKANDLSMVREIHLLHLSNENADQDYFKLEVMKATGKPVCVAKA